MRFRAALFFFFLFRIAAFAATDSTFVLKKFAPFSSNEFSDPSVEVTGKWKYMKGDNPAWADTSLDDSKWTLVSSSFPLAEMPEGTFAGIGWFRKWIDVPEIYSNKPLGLMITQSGASEIYLDGKLIHTFGKIDSKNEERFDPQLLPVDIMFDGPGPHLLAVRYAHANATEDARSGYNAFPGFTMRMGELSDYARFHYSNSNILVGIFTFYFTFFSALAFLHLVIFLFNRSVKPNLYYSIFAGSFGLVFLCILSSKTLMDQDSNSVMQNLMMFLPDIYAPALLAMLYSVFYGRVIKIFWLWLGLFAIDFVLNVFNVDFSWIGAIAFLVFCVESLRVIIVAIIKKKDGSWIIGSGIIITILFLSAFFILASVGQGEFTFANNTGVAGLLFGLLVIYITLSIPISMTIYLARDFARTSKNLGKKLIEVEELSKKTIEQEKERQRILENQNEVLEVQVSERTHEITEQKKEIEEKNKDITDSIVYAKRIQDALLPSSEFIGQLFRESFVLFRPKDIVSGDFYWAAQKGERVFFAAVDCTGHGVPGALMSMIGSNILDHIVNEKKLIAPSEILDQLHLDIVSALKQREDTDRKDGMDIALITIENNTLQFAGAQRPMWIVRNGELLELKGDKLSIGGTHHQEGQKFSNHGIELQHDDCIYLFSDGYADQFGGDGGKKFMTRRMKELLIRVAPISMVEQKVEIDNAFKMWKGSVSQVDDILITGIRY